MWGSVFYDRLIAPANGRHVSSKPVRCGTVSVRILSDVAPYPSDVAPYPVCFASVGIPRTRGPQSTSAGLGVRVVLGSIPSLLTFAPLSCCSLCFLRSGCVCSLYASFPRHSSFLLLGQGAPTRICTSRTPC
jgi:hypothetical protein